MTIDAFTTHAQGNNSTDPVLVPLSRRQAARLVHLALSSSADLGLAVRYQGGAALVPADRSADYPVVGLSNLARTVAQFTEDRWPLLVREHISQVVEQLRSGPPTPTDPERELIQRLVPRDALPSGWALDRPEFLPGLLSVPSTADDTIVTMYLEPADLGLTWSDAERFGLANLRQLTDVVEYVDHDDLRIAFISGTPFAASRALVLDTVLRESLHLEHPPPHGVLAAMPARDTLLLHVIQDLSVIPALGLLLNLAARCHARDPGPLSPDVYLVTPDFHWLPATTVLPDHAPLRLSPDLESLTKLLATQELPPNPRHQQMP
ncbi:hypothetical protein [Kribbella kalugense]|uniref:Uncharacterized protein n=1 Tax=Kribbella kalugense TaxID=2512221 RepID=A0A4R7ZNX8_9ACTN|nr:hypothetical protein [Kribbella kalugense]TDW19056.1 hypothetical protein EV650_5659 [Kribbella kalugense]